ncbi:MAG: hypothetical protein MK212_21355 [Saprospiraceae bacterium]|nr:hypothetical protein [Saprospiraceae bacterium]
MHPKTTVLLIFLTCILMQSCSSEHAKDMDSNQNPFEHITLIDTFTNELQPYTEGLYGMPRGIPPFYIGNDTSKIFMTYNSPTELAPVRFFRREPVIPNSPLTGKRLDYPNLTIYVDTNQFIGYYKRLNDSPPLEDRLARKNWQPIFGRGNILCHPVFMKNNKTSEITIGYGESLYLLLQAQDRNGEWQILQTTPNYCGGPDDGIGPFYLGAQQIVVASSPIYKGNYKTKFRIAYGWVFNKKKYFNDKYRIYSNEFEGSIDYDLVHPKETSL